MMSGEEEGRSMSGGGGGGGGEMGPGGGENKRKNTSFKITNILPSRPPSHDPEESGEDDPDDSHTEDISDGTAEIGSPRRAKKEDEYSSSSTSGRRNSFDAAAAAAAALVAAGGTREAAVSILSSNGLPASAFNIIQEAVPVFSANAKWVSSVLSVSSHQNVQPDATHGPRDRFKVVRMETTEPLKRGRWTCIDFVDKRTAAPSTSSVPSSVDPPINELMAASSTSSSAVLHPENEVIEDDRLKVTPNLEGATPTTIPSSSSSAVPSSSQHIPSLSSIVDPVRLNNIGSAPQTPSAVQSPSTAPSYIPSSTSIPQQQVLQQLLQQQKAPSPQQVIQFVPPVTCQSLKQQQPLLLQQPTTNLVSSSSQQPVPSPQIATSTHHQLVLDGGSTASYITPINYGGLLPSSSTVNSIPPSRAETADVCPPPSFYPAPFDHPIDNEHLVERLEEISTQQNAPYVEEDNDNSCEILGPPGRGGGGYKSLRGNNNMLLGETNNNSQQRYFPRSDGASHPQLTSAGVSRLTSRGVSPARDRASDGYHHHQQHQLFASFCSASGSNQGAIDNRIEQAMDLVKSHLMNAVRSEVEELKERIVKLEDVITHLQTENDFLKANVSQDVLTQLPVLSQTQQQSSLPCSGGTPTTNNGGGGLSPTTGTAILQPLVVTTQQQPQL